MIRDWQSHIVVPLSTFADQDVLKVISDAEERASEERKILEAKRAAARAAEQATEPAADEDGEEEEEDEADEADEAEGEDADAAPAPAAEAGDGEKASKTETGPVHEGVACDGCKVSVPVNTSRLVIDKYLLQTGDSIVGCRWKCAICANYDLCNSCHSAGIHDEHRKLKIEDPADAPEVADVVRANHFVLRARCLKHGRNRLTRTTSTRFFWASECIPRATLLSRSLASLRTVRSFPGRGLDTCQKSAPLGNCLALKFMRF